MRLLVTYVCSVLQEQVKRKLVEIAQQPSRKVLSCSASAKSSDAPGDMDALPCSEALLSWELASCLSGEGGRGGSVTDAGDGKLQLYLNQSLNQKTMPQGGKHRRSPVGVQHQATPLPSPRGEGSLKLSTDGLKLSPPGGNWSPVNNVAPSPCSPPALGGGGGQLNETPEQVSSLYIYTHTHTCLYIYTGMPV